MFAASTRPYGSHAAAAQPILGAVSVGHMELADPATKTWTSETNVSNSATTPSKSESKISNFESKTGK